MIFLSGGARCIADHLSPRPAQFSPHALHAILSQSVRGTARGPKCKIFADCTARKRGEMVFCPRGRIQLSMLWLALQAEKPAPLRRDTRPASAAKVPKATAVITRSSPAHRGRSAPKNAMARDMLQKPKPKSRRSHGICKSAKLASISPALKGMSPELTMLHQVCGEKLITPSPGMPGPGISSQGFSHTLSMCRLQHCGTATVVCIMS
jgi:hypothetical protein